MRNYPCVVSLNPSHQWSITMYNLSILFSASARRFVMSWAVLTRRFLISVARLILMACYGSFEQRLRSSGGQQCITKTFPFLALLEVWKSRKWKVCTDGAVRKKIRGRLLGRLSRSIMQAVMAMVHNNTWMCTQIKERTIVID